VCGVATNNSSYKDIKEFLSSPQRKSEDHGGKRGGEDRRKSFEESDKKKISNRANKTFVRLLFFV